MNKLMSGRMKPVDQETYDLGVRLRRFARALIGLPNPSVEVKSTTKNKEVHRVEK